jgi:DNA/RNA-binding domain of Phe-tRNA-synthetase-like protein
MKYRELLYDLLFNYVEALECRDLSVTVNRPDIRQELINVVKSLNASEGLRKNLNYYTQVYKDFLKNYLKAPYSKTGYSPENLARTFLRNPLARVKNDLEGIRYVTELKTFIPTLMVDSDKVSLPLILRKALKRETIPSLKSVLELSGYELVLADSANRPIYVLFSKRNKLYAVSRNTARVIVLSFGVHGLPRYFVNQSVNTFKKLIAMYYPQSVCEHLNVRAIVKTP